VEGRRDKEGREEGGREGGRGEHSSLIFLTSLCLLSDLTSLIVGIKKQTFDITNEEDTPVSEIDPPLP
jgi:hypothetical protein